MHVFYAFPKATQISIYFMFKIVIQLNISVEVTYTCPRSKKMQFNHKK